MMPRVLPMAAMLVAAAVVCGCDVPTRASHTRDGGRVEVPPPPPPPQPTPPPGGGTFSIEGEYQLTITASPSCSLPPEVRQRTYTATIAESQSGAVKVTLSGAEFILFTPTDKAGFDGTRSGDKVRFLIDNGYGGEYYFIERIDGTRNLVVEGIADVAASEHSIVGTFNGELRYFVPLQRPWLGDCSASDHKISFTR